MNELPLFLGGLIVRDHQLALDADAFRAFRRKIRCGRPALVTRSTFGARQSGAELRTGLETEFTRHGLPV